MVEDARLFRRGIGDESEVVSKEMYEFTDRGGRALALRPEGTASVVRAFVQHHPPMPWKAWYVTPAFRYERPQAGRYRQHHQLGVEALGTEDPDLDVEVIALAAGFYADLGLRRIDLAVNSMGCAEDRPRYVAALRAFLAEHAGGALRRAPGALRRQPAAGPRLQETGVSGRDRGRPDAGRLPGRGLRRPLRPGAGRPRRAAASAYRIEPRLVRGLDYYTRTTFEFAGLALDAAQNAVGGGGRYDGLSRPSAGRRHRVSASASGSRGCCWPATPRAASPSSRRPADAFVVDLTGGEEARDLVEELRGAGLTALRAYDGRSPKSQMKQADKSGARFAVIVGRRRTVRRGRHSATPARGRGRQDRGADGGPVRDRGPVGRSERATG